MSYSARILSSDAQSVLWCSVFRTVYVELRMGGNDLEKRMYFTAGVYLIEQVTWRKPEQFMDITWSSDLNYNLRECFYTRGMTFGPSLVKMSNILFLFLSVMINIFDILGPTYQKFLFVTTLWQYPEIW